METIGKFASARRISYLFTTESSDAVDDIDSDRVIDLGKRREVEIGAQEIDQRVTLLRQQRLEQVAELRLVEFPDVALQRVGQEAILHDRRNGRAHVINESAARIWDLCDGQASLDEIAIALAASYNIEASVVRGDVAQIIAKFRELRILET